MLNESNIPLEEDGIEEEILVEDELTITKAMWGDIGGNIANQTDLQNALDAKQDDLTEAQLNAVNSGITAEKVTTYDGYADQIASKANQSALNAESTTRAQADTALGRRIDDEATARQNADNGLQTQIDAITSKSDVVDVVANYAALQAYDTGTLSDKDVVKVLDDETHEDALTYYRWSTTTQTWTYIGQEAPYYSKGQMDVKLAEKQDTLTAGANIQIQNGTISATDTTYTAGNGLNLNGTEFSADTTVLATKEDLEDYYTKPETDNLLAPKLEAEVVAELPTTGEEGKLYLTPKAHTTQTATGNPITATVAEDAGAIESFQLDGDTFQQSYTGKNLFDTANADIREQYILNDSGVEVSDRTGGYTRNYSKVEPSTGYILSGLDTIGGKTRRVYYYDENKGFIGRSAQITTGSPTLTFTTPANCYFVNIQIFYPDDLDTSSWQLEAGSSATAYEPYVGGQPSPSPSYPQQIQTVTGTQTVEVVGKNLFSSELVQGYYAFANGNYSSNSSSYVTNKNKISVTAGQTYTISANKGVYAGSDYTGAGVVFFNNGTYVSSQLRPENGTFTVPSGANQVVYNFYKGNSDASIAPSDITWAQLELGSTASSYAPYSKQTLPINLGSIELCKLGTYQDYIYKSGDDWKVHKATATITLDGSSDEHWEKSNNVFFEYSGYSYVGDVGVGSTALSPSFIYWPNTGGISNNMPNLEFGIPATKVGIGIRNDSIADADALRTWLATNVFKAYVSLATATDTAITDQTLIAQLEAIRTASLQNGANTITNTATGSNLAGDMEIGYYGFAPRNRYDKWLWLDINNEYEQIGS